MDYIIFGIPQMELKNSWVPTQNNKLLLVYQKTNEMKIENNIVNWQVRAVGTFTQIKLWIYQQIQLVRLIAERTIILMIIVWRQTTLTSCIITTGSAARIINVKNNKNVIDLDKEGHVLALTGSLKSKTRKNFSDKTENVTRLFNLRDWILLGSKLVRSLSKLNL